MTKAKIQAEVELSTANAEQGFAKVASSAESMSSSIRKSGKTAGDGLATIGDGGDKSAVKVDRATNSMIASIQRTTAAYEAGGKSSSKYYETLANQRGVSVDALRPYLTQLDQVSKAQVNTGMSAAQMSNNLRMVPAQFTDIVTSLQGGQKPITVLLQQGGQLKDMFGGIGPAAKAMGGYVMGMVNPLTLAAVAVGGIGYAYSQSNTTAKEFQKNIVASGDAAGMTVSNLIQLTNKVQTLGVGTTGAAREAINLLLEGGKVSSSQIESATIAALNAQTYLGRAVKDTAKEFADLSGSPTAAIEKLNDKYHFLTVEIYSQIKALENQGKVADAANLASSSYADSITNQAEKVNMTLSDWERGWIRIKNAAAGVVSASINIFDDETNANKIKRMLNQIENKEAYKKDPNSSVSRTAQIDAEIAALTREINKLRESDDAKNQSAKASENKNKADAAGIDFIKEEEKYLGKQAQALREVAKAKSLWLASGTKEDPHTENDKRLLDIQSKINEKYKEKATHLSKEENAYKSLAKTIQENLIASKIELSTGESLTESQKLRIKLMDLVAGGHSKISKEKIQEMEKGIFLGRSNELARKSYEDFEKSLKSFSVTFTASDITDQIKLQDKNYLSMFNSMESYARQMEENNTLAQYEIGLLGLSGVERTSLINQKKIEIQLEKQLKEIRESTMAEGQKNILIDKANSQARIDNDTAYLRATQQEYAKTVEKYDSIFSKGFSDMLNNGKGAWSAFTQSLKTTFKTQLADEIYKMFARPFVVKLVGSLMGVTSVAATAQGIGGGGLGSAASAISTGKSLWEGFSAAGSLSGGLASATAFASGLTGIGAAGANSIAAASFAAKSAALSSGLTGSAVTTAGTTAGAASAGGMGASISSAMGAIPVWGWALLGAAAVASFGGGKDRVTGAQSVSGTLGTNDINRNVDWTKDGGWFHSNTSGTWNYNLANSTAIASNGKSYQDTPNLANDQKLLTQLNSAYDAIKNANGDYAKSLGLNADLIVGRVDKMSFALGKSQEENDKAIKDMFSGIADSMATTLIPTIASMTKKGETASDALGRIATGFGTANAIFADLNLKLFSIGDAGYKASAVFVDLVGGLEGLKNVSQSYYENFFSEAEKNANVLKMLTTEFEKQGKVLPTSRDGFRAIVEEISKTGTPEQLASILKLNGAFASIIPAVDEVALKAAAAAKELSKAAEQMAAIAQERAGLQSQYDDLTLSDAEKLKRKRDALYDDNKALFDQIQAQLANIDAIKLASEALSAKQAAEREAAEEQFRVAKAIQEVWQGAANTIVDEMNRIRGVMGKSQGASSLAAAQAQFTLSAMQARAGDLDAAKLLPSLSKAMLDLYESQASSDLDLLLMQARTAQSLEDTLRLLQANRGGGLELPVSSSSTPSMMAQPTSSNVLVPPIYSQAQPVNNTEPLVQALRAEITELRIALVSLSTAVENGNTNTAEIKKTLNMVTEGGRAMQTEAYS